jgi:predicted RNase H-like HicB family nuclease
MVVVYPAIFHTNDDESVTVTFPDLPGCVTEGKSVSNALYMARDALALWIDSTQMVGDQVPTPSSAQSVRVVEGEYVTLIDAETEIYARQRNNKAVKRTVSLPQWLDERAMMENISLSKELQAALSARFQE